MTQLPAPSPAPGEEPGDPPPELRALDGEPDPRFRIDRTRLPRRVDLTLPPELLQQLEELATRSGRDLEDVLVEALDRMLGPNCDSRGGGGW